MSEMVERVSRALCRLAFRSGDIPPHDVERQVDLNWHLFPEHARAALEAMREPTEDMFRGTMDLISGQKPFSPIEYWHAMIDEALK